MDEGQLSANKLPHAVNLTRLDLRDAVVYCMCVKVSQPYLPRYPGTQGHIYRDVGHAAEPLEAIPRALECHSFVLGRYRPPLRLSVARRS